MCGINEAFYLLAAIKQEFVSQFISRGDLGAHNQVQSLFLDFGVGRKYNGHRWHSSGLQVGCVSFGRWFHGQGCRINSTQPLLRMRGRRPVI